MAKVATVNMSILPAIPSPPNAPRKGYTFPVGDMRKGRSKKIVQLSCNWGFVVVNASNSSTQLRRERGGAAPGARRAADRTRGDHGRLGPDAAARRGRQQRRRDEEHAEHRDDDQPEDIAVDSGDEIQQGLYGSLLAPALACFAREVMPLLPAFMRERVSGSCVVA